MKFSVELVRQTMTDLMQEATVTVDGVEQVAPRSLLASIKDDLPGEEWATFVMGALEVLTDSIARDMANDTGAPITQVLGPAHAMATMNLTAYMMAVGIKLARQEFAAVGDITDETIEAGLRSILGGSNE